MPNELKQLDLKAMGRRIRSTRDARGLTREELAELLELSPQFIADVEYGNKGVSVRTLYQISQVLRISSEYLLSGVLYDIDKNEDAARFCNEIKETINAFDEEALKGFREISRIYADTLNKIKE